MLYASPLGLAGGNDFLSSAAATCMLNLFFSKVKMKNKVGFDDGPPGLAAIPEPVLGML